MVPRRRLFPFIGTTLAAGLSVYSVSLIAMSLPWIIISGGRGAGLAGTIAFALHLPAVIGMFYGGRLIDRLGARRVLVASDWGGLGAMLAALALVAAVPDALWSVVALLALANLIGAPSIVAQGARLPEIARLARLPLVTANTVREIVHGLAYAAGPASSVLIVEAFGLIGVITVASVVLLGLALLDLAAFPRFVVKAQPMGAPEEGGYRLSQDATLMLILVLGVLLVGIYTSLDEILAPALVVDADKGAPVLALYLVLIALSSLCSSLVFAFVGHRVPQGTVFTVACGGFAVGLWLLALLPREAALIVAPIVMGLSVGPMGPIVMTAIQARVPVAVRGFILGRVSAYIMGAQPFAALAAGPAVDAVGPSTVAVFIASVAVLAAAIAILNPAMRDLDR